MEVLQGNALVQDRIRGCLLGVAIGDALGAPFEEVGPGRTNRKFEWADGKITDFHPFLNFPPGTWTDDTGMTLAGCRALIRHETTGQDTAECFRQAFREWAVSPGCRRPGYTVYQASKTGVTDENAWGSGALMRTAPIGIYAYLKRLYTSHAMGLAITAARCTHGHPLATFPGAEMTRTVLSILSGEDDVPADLSKSWRMTSETDQHDPRYKEYEYLRILRMNLHLTSELMSNPKSIVQSIDPTTGLWIWKRVFEVILRLSDGVSWTVLPGFEEGILRAVNDGYDRDTCGAVAGALLGAYWGLKGIPERWADRVEGRNEIIALADELITAVKGKGWGADSAGQNPSRRKGIDLDTLILKIQDHKGRALASELGNTDWN